MISVTHKFFTWENVAGHYVNILPVITVFPKREGFRDNFNMIHIGWLVWIVYIRFGTKS